MLQSLTINFQTCGPPPPYLDTSKRESHPGELKARIKAIEAKFNDKISNHLEFYLIFKS